MGEINADTGYVGILGRMLKWAGTGLVLLGIAGRKVSGCERSEGDLGLRSLETTSEDDLVPRMFRENLGGRRGSRISDLGSLVTTSKMEKVSEISYSNLSDISERVSVCV